MGCGVGEDPGLGYGIGDGEFLRELRGLGLEKRGIMGRDWDWDLDWDQWDWDQRGNGSMGWDEIRMG